MKIRPFDVADTEHVVALWAAAGLTKPWNDPRKDITRKLAVQPELFVVAESESGSVIGTAMAGYDGHRGWLYYLATAPDARGLGVGQALVEHVERALLNLGCPSRCGLATPSRWGSSTGSGTRWTKPRASASD